MLSRLEELMTVTSETSRYNAKKIKPTNVKCKLIIFFILLMATRKTVHHITVIVVIVEVIVVYDKETPPKIIQFKNLNISPNPTFHLYHDPPEYTARTFDTLFPVV